MALNWKWDEKCGEAVIQQRGKEFTLNLYKGNAYLIFISEYKDEDGQNMYSLYSFFADKDHMRNCLGLSKAKGRGLCENIFNSGGDILKSIRINKAKYPYTKDLVYALTQAFDNLTIEIYSEEG